MKKVFVLITIYLIINIQASFGQSGYLTKSDTSFYNIKMLNQGAVKNGLTCIFIKGNTTQEEYTPEQVTQYGLNKDVVYLATNITIDGKQKRVFLLRLVSGKVSLFSFVSKKGEEHFFLAKGDTTELAEIDLNDYRAQAQYASYVSDCNRALENSKYVTHTRGSLIRFVRDYNTCSTHPLPRLTYGFRVGLSASKLNSANISGVLRNVNFKNNITLTVGAFLEIPLGASSFSFRPEILYRRNSSTYAFKNLNIDYDLVINNSTVTTPLMIEYLLPGVRNRAFLEAGINYALALKNETSLYQYTTSGNDIFIEVDDQPVIAKSQLGFSIGGGVRIDVLENFWLLGFRITKLSGAKSAVDYLSVQEVVFSVSRTF
ncbi:MAG: PorT family protein [Cyclobacteriaceae bacterium]|nr:PorT family protein [Cyclobacteriaceae bacterium]